MATQCPKYVGPDLCICKLNSPHTSALRKNESQNISEENE
jgi:hypothetical protein